MSLTAGLVSYWKLDESSGNALDAVGANTLTNNAAVGTAAGKINTARDFESSTFQFFSIADNAALSTGDVDFAISAWVNIESKPASPMNIVAKREGAGNLEYWLRWNNATDRFQFLVTHDGTTQATVTANTFGAPALATWYFVMCWHDSVANTLNIQVNNGTVDSVAHALGVFNGIASFRIGAGAGGSSEWWDGLIDEVGFWKTYLPNAADRTRLYGAGSGLAYTQFNDEHPRAPGMPAGRSPGTSLYDGSRSQRRRKR